jgi:nicotinamidase-related amidase
MTILLPLPPHARSALAIVDMQAFFFQKPERRRNLASVLANINRLIHFFEVQEFPIVHAITCFQADGSDWDLKMKQTGKPELIENSPETAILPEIQVSPSHRIVKKTRYSAFFRTDLARFLNDADVRRLVVVGAYTHYCVNATVFDAYAYDFIPAIITDAVISHLQDESALLIERMQRNGYHVFHTGEFIENA